MFATKKLVRGLVAKIRKVERETLDALRSGRVEQEPALTDRLLGVMEHVLNNETIGGVTWRVKTLTDRGRGAQETEFGADFLAAFQAQLEDFNVAKGFLGQSKLIEPSQSFARAEVDHLKRQCERMLSHSPASYVFLYSQQSGIVVVPASEVLGARDCNPHELTTKSLSKFYEEHFECFIGDTGIKSADPQALDGLRERYRARRLFHFSGAARQWRS